jgi:ABC-type Fe3+/spermidine/putrescine transport system ATPase subunit
MERMGRRQVTLGTKPSAGRSGSSAAVHVVDVWKTLGGTQILSGVDLAVEPGEFVTLLGPSGSGKTSTLMAIAGFLVPERGQILVGDRDVTRLPPGRDRDMGIVFQNYALFPHMSVAKNIAYPLAVRGLSRQVIQKKVAEAISLVQLEGLEERKPVRLSGGQQQRVALARALVFEPSVLLMDEPMGALDVRLKQELQWEIRRLQRTLGTTVIYVTHDQDEAMVLSDRIALMRNGKIEQYGTPQELYRAPGSIFAARFLGESNLIAGVYRTRSGPALEVTATETTLPLFHARADLAEGQACAALLRPEALSVIPHDRTRPADPDSFCLPATIVEAVFIGQAVRYQIEVPELGRRFTVQQPMRADIAQLAPEDAALVRWHASDMHLVPEAAS